MPGVESALTRAAVRGRLKVSNDTGRNWITRGIFPAEKIETGEVGI